MNDIETRLASLEARVAQLEAQQSTTTPSKPDGPVDVSAAMSEVLAEHQGPWAGFAKSDGGFSIVCPISLLSSPLGVVDADGSRWRIVPVRKANGDTQLAAVAQGGSESADKDSDWHDEPVRFCSDWRGVRTAQVQADGFLAAAARKDVD